MFVIGILNGICTKKEMEEFLGLHYVDLFPRNTNTNGVLDSLLWWNIQMSPKGKQAITVCYKSVKTSLTHLPQRLLTTRTMIVEEMSAPTAWLVVWNRKLLS